MTGKCLGARPVWLALSNILADARVREDAEPERLQWLELTLKVPLRIDDGTCIEKDFGLDEDFADTLSKQSKRWATVTEHKLKAFFWSVFTRVKGRECAGPHRRLQIHVNWDYIQDDRS